MTRQEEATLWESVAQLLSESAGGADRFARLLQLLLNEAMRLEGAIRCPGCWAL